jgi:hypothetical protein
MVRVLVLYGLGYTLGGEFASSQTGNAPSLATSRSAEYPPYKHHYPLGVYHKYSMPDLRSHPERHFSVRGDDLHLTVRMHLAALQIHRDRANGPPNGSSDCLPLVRPRSYARRPSAVHGDDLHLMVRVRGQRQARDSALTLFVMYPFFTNISTTDAISSGSPTRPIGIRACNLGLAQLSTRLPMIHSLPRISAEERASSRYLTGRMSFLSAKMKASPTGDKCRRDAVARLAGRGLSVHARWGRMRERALTTPSRAYRCAIQWMIPCSADFEDA